MIEATIDSEWHSVANGDYPPVGETVEAQDGVLVHWGGVNWWSKSQWKTHLVTRWRYPQVPE